MMSAASRTRDLGYAVVNDLSSRAGSGLVGCLRQFSGVPKVQSARLAGDAS